MTRIPFYQVDAFTDIAFSGNPAGLCILEKELSEPVMQNIALETNLPETAFLLEQTGGYSLRWFTPTTELKLCGHGTLATAHILWEQSLLDGTATARFFTKSGLLTVEKRDDGIEMNFPAFTYQSTSPPEAMLHALGVTPLQTVCAQDGRYVVEVADEQLLRSLTPDFSLLKKHPSVVVTCAGAEGSRYDFLSRSFAPAHGIDEDPVTGSSHCALVPYWSDKLHKKTFLAYQASARGGELQLELRDDKVLIRGRAVTVIEGSFIIRA